MSVVVVIGAQWGDEGKGKIVDAIASSVDFTIRYNGGNNAGHTVINKFGTFPLHIIPCGVFSKKAKSYISNGVVIDPGVLVGEIELLQKAKIDLQSRLFISPRAHIILSYHKLFDRLFEEAKAGGKTGTTGRGIGPVYADKVSYNGIRVSDFIDKKKFKKKLETQLLIKNKILKAFGEKPLTLEQIEKEYAPFRKVISPFVKELFGEINKGLVSNKQILLEGAQAVFLDTDWGTYPFTTASSMLPGSINALAGIPPQKITNTIGVVKAYITRVGAGPFPTELLDATGEKLRSIGHEFGTTTGRPRRCGWFDAELVRFACELSGISEIALTKLDVLDTFKEIKICTGYSLNNKKVRYYDGDEVFLGKVKPLYKIMKGWNTSIQGIKKFEDLPVNTKKYILEIEKLAGVKVKYISTGPSRDALIVR